MYKYRYKMSKKRINLTVDEKVYREFKKYCEERGMVVSKKVELYMQRELKEKNEYN